MLSPLKRPLTFVGSLISSLLHLHAQEFYRVLPRGLITLTGMSPSAPYTPSTQLLHGVSALNFPSRFGGILAQGPWSPENLLVASQLHRSLDVSNGTIPSATGPHCSSAQRGFAHNSIHIDSSTHWRQIGAHLDEDRRELENRKRNATCDFQQPYFKEMASTHAENREPRIEIPVTSQQFR